MFSQLPSVVQQFINNRGGSKRSKQLQVNILEVLQALQANQQVPLRQLLQLLTQLLQVQETQLAALCDQLMKLLTKDPLQQSIKASARINVQPARRPIISELLEQHTQLRGSGQFYLQREMQLLDQLMGAAAQQNQSQQSQFLLDLNAEEFSEVLQDEPQREQVRSGEEILQQEQELRSGDELRLSALERLEDDYHDVNLSNTAMDFSHSSHHDERLETQILEALEKKEAARKPRKQDKKVKKRALNFVFVEDDFPEQELQESIQAETEQTTLATRVLEPMLIMGKLDALINVPDQTETVPDLPESTWLDDTTTVEPDKQRRPVKVDFSGSLTSLEGVQSGEYQNLKMLPGGLVENFMRALADYRQDRVDLVQRGEEVFVRATQM